MNWWQAIWLFWTILIVARVMAQPNHAPRNGDWAERAALAICCIGLVWSS